jgi:hypothetical protein
MFQIKITNKLENIEKYTQICIYIYIHIYEYHIVLPNTSGECLLTCLLGEAHMSTSASITGTSKYPAVRSPLYRDTLASSSAALACTSSFWSESKRFSIYGDTYIYIYIYMYGDTFIWNIYIHIYVYICTYIYIYIFICI